MIYLLSGMTIDRRLHFDLGIHEFTFFIKYNRLIRGFN